ncbi:MAG: YkvA family protein [Burkholderiales bacterium]
MLKSWKRRVRVIKRDIHALYLAYRDPRTPWYAKWVVACVIAYALSPIDLIPDPIPVLGYLDDLILLPLGIILALRLIPSGVMVECRERAQAAIDQNLPANWVAAGVIAVIWVAAAIVLGVFLYRSVL